LQTWSKHFNLEFIEMDRQDVCILINSTPKYYYLLPLQLTLLQRYAPKLKWPIYFATEQLDHPIVLKLIIQFGVKVLALQGSESGFLESRLAALQKLSSEISYVLPLQEDFLLDRTPDYKALLDALFILDTDRFVSSLRLNPCPGPQSNDLVYTKDKPWKILGEKNQYIFTYQATLWRKMDILSYYKELIKHINRDYETEERRKYAALTLNLGETSFGQDLLQTCLPNVMHLSCPRAGSWSNAIYLCPWPYRPTAVVRGHLEPFAKELFEREGIKLESPTTNLL
jgi:hypothetical protein